MSLRNKFIKYIPEITLDIFKLIYTKLKGSGWKQNDSVEKLYEEFSKSQYDCLMENADDKRFLCYHANSDLTEISIKDFLGYDPFVKRTTLETWLEETKAKNLSFGQLRAYINYGITCPYEEVYSKLKGHEIKDKAKILFDKWNTSKEFILPKKWHIHSNDEIDSILVKWRGRDHVGSAVSSILQSTKCWCCILDSDSIEINFEQFQKYVLKINPKEDLLTEIINPNTKESLLAKALKDYPVGTVYIPAGSNNDKYTVVEAIQEFRNLDLIYAEWGKGSLYKDGKWAEIVSRVDYDNQNVLIVPIIAEKYVEPVPYKRKESLTEQYFPKVVELNFD